MQTFIQLFDQKHIYQVHRTYINISLSYVCIHFTNVNFITLQYYYYYILNYYFT